jgi:hypothetical protein
MLDPSNHPVWPRSLSLISLNMRKKSGTPPDGSSTCFGNRPKGVNLNLS